MLHMDVEFPKDQITSKTEETIGIDKTIIIGMEEIMAMAKMIVL